MATNCGACKSTINKNSYAILCFSCDKWYHIKCVDMQVTTVNFYERQLKISTGERWNCPMCSKTIVESSQKERKSLINSENLPRNYTLNDVMEKLTKIEAQHEDLIEKYERQLTINELLQNEIKNIKTHLISELQHELEEVKSKLSDFSKGSSLPGEEVSSSAPVQSVIEEMRDREVRRKNVLVFGLEELHDADPQNREKNDLTSVNQILKPLSSVAKLEDAKIHRIGKYNENKIRPIRVVLQSFTEAVSILKNKSKISGNVYLKADKTPTERKLMQDLIAELNNRKQRGEIDIHIKYIRGVPKIIKKSKN